MPPSWHAGGLRWHGCGCYAVQQWQTVVSTRPAAVRRVRTAKEDAAPIVATEEEGWSCSAVMAQPRATGLGTAGRVEENSEGKKAWQRRMGKLQGERRL
jgi:hypothetical protein